MSFKENYNESILNEDKFEKVAILTDENDSTGVRIEVCKILKTNTLQKAYEGLMSIQNVFGHSPKEVLDIRTKLDKMLHATAKNKLSKEDYEDFTESL